MVKDKNMMDAAEKCLEALDAADAAGDAIPSFEPREPRIELDDQAEDDGAIPDAERIRFRFPVYIRHLLAKAIAVQRETPDDPPRSLDPWTDDELADFADAGANAQQVYFAGDRAADRKSAYLRIFAVALRHFQNDPEAVAASIRVVGMIVRSGKAS